MKSYAAMAITLALSLAFNGAHAFAQQQPAFATPEEAVKALGEAAKSSDLTALIALLGPGSRELANSSDATTARKNRDIFVAAMAERWTLEDRDATHKELVVGNEKWPFPVPLVKGANGWVFDGAAGKEEVLARRIGRNELSAIRVANIIVRAQKLYASRGHDGKPAGIYARRVASDPGTENGLYWPPVAGKPRSPVSQLVAGAALEGRSGSSAKGRTPYYGYYFRLLEAQGPAAAGGAKSYLVNGQLSGGFALIAWPAQPEVTGVMTFIVNHDGVIFEKSFGAKTQSAVSAISQFNPDASWAKVETPPTPAKAPPRQ
jgi:hypothetical protein